MSNLDLDNIIKIDGEVVLNYLEMLIYVYCLRLQYYLNILEAKLWNHFKMKEIDGYSMILFI